MSYAHYWLWEQSIIARERFILWSRDIRKLLEEYPSYPNHWYWEGIAPYPLPKNWDMKKICGPQGVGKPITTETEVAFNGDKAALNSYEPLRITLKALQEPGGFEGCKTNYKPYDLMVTAALIRLRYYFSEIYISSDGKARGFQQGVQFCRDVFSVGESPTQADEDLFEELLCRR